MRHTCSLTKGELIMAKTKAKKAAKKGGKKK